MLLQHCQPLLAKNFRVIAQMQQPPALTVLRRENLIVLFHEFASSRVQADGSTKGLQTAFAAEMQVSPSLWSLLKSGQRQVGEKLARQVEVAFKLPRGWLDEKHEAVVVSDAKASFLEMCSVIWDGAGAQGRRRLMRMAKKASANPRGVFDVAGAEGQEASLAPTRSPARG